MAGERLMWGERVTRSASLLRASRPQARLAPGSSGWVVGGDGGVGTVIGYAPGADCLVFVLWDEETEGAARAINVKNLVRLKEPNALHLDACRAEQGEPHA